VKIISTLSELLTIISAFKNEGKTIGFVPTMGALHEGHMDLIRIAKAQSSVVITSVFVNPTQFNNPADLSLYPRTPELDAAILMKNGCDVAFFPSIETIYPPNLVTPSIDIAHLEKVMEGAFRPGHFVGVVQVVYRFFELIQPDYAFFGQKDFQQVAVIQHMVKQLNLSVAIIPCPTKRDINGLAMSSRNLRLSTSEKKQALVIYKTLLFCEEHAHIMSPDALRIAAIAEFERGELRLEYLTISTTDTLEELSEDWPASAVVCIACYCGDVRLIDNFILHFD
jgi:pantoate--beta-alanine ligase